MTGADRVVLGATLGFIGVLMWFVPVMKGRDAFFGITVSEALYRSPLARRYLLIYRTLVCLLIGGAAAFALTATLTAGALLTLVLVAALGPSVFLVVFWYALRPYEEARPSGQPLPPGERLPQWTYVTPWVEGLLLAALLLAVGLVLWRYPELPGRIPVHWNAAGRADGWTAKSPWPLVSLLLIMAFTHGFLLWLLVGLSQVPVRAPAERGDEYRAAHFRYMRFWAQWTNVLRGLVLLMFLGIIWASLFGIERQAGGVMPPGMVLVWIGTAGLLLSLPWLVIGGLRLRSAMREIAGAGSLEQAAPTEGWIAGSIYYNKRDPAVWVEKRIGIGWTLNFARPVSWLVMLLALGIPIGATILALSAGR